MAPQKSSERYWRNVHSKRLQGIYHIEDTRDETEVSVRQMLPGDVAITLIHNHGVFNAYNNREFLPQVADWRRLKCVLLDANVWEIKIAGRNMFMFIVQPEDMSRAPMSPLAIAYGKLVNGFAYITPYQSTVDLVKRALQQQ
jgi:hypothetical protein